MSSNENGVGSSSGGGSLRRPRGRPPSISATRDRPIAHPIRVMAIPAGADVVACLAHLGRRLRRTVFVFGGSGTVANITLLQSGAPTQMYRLEGCFEILSLTGSIPFFPALCSLTVSIASGQGHVMGGPVAGTLVAAGPVFVIVTTFPDAIFERSSSEDSDDTDTDDTDSDDTDSAGGGGNWPPPMGSSNGQLLSGLPHSSSSMPVLNLPPNVLSNGAGLPHSWSMPVLPLNLPPNVLSNGTGLPHLSSMPVLNLNLPPNVLSNDADLPHSSSMPILNLSLPPNVLPNGAGLPHPSSMPILNLNLPPNVHSNDAGPPPIHISNGATIPMLNDIIHRDTDTETGGRDSG
ncbi:hypothetical protein NE237_014554 [Protea cynaroides]|uniref:PPC domain-containing protein n=1 Tax=Protea cynaroides TaxID=273540 RepID=A0A9Q0KC84_9MAGN|nr:hypothetical protein NE237_014554 [Protea cynaroides]